MKAFSADIFTEKTKASLREEAYKIIKSDPTTINSVLEFDDFLVENQLQYNRQKYISLLEAQRKGLEVIDEGFGSTLAITLLISFVIGFIGSLLGLFKGTKTVTFRVPINGGGSGGSEDFKTYTIAPYLGADKLPCNNPYININLKEIKGTPVSIIKQMAENKTIEITQYTYPSMNIVSGNVNNVLNDGLMDMAQSISSDIGAVFEGGQFNKEDIIERSKNNIDRCKEFKKILGDISSEQMRGSEDMVNINAKDYLTKRFEWFKGYSNGWKFNDIVENTYNSLVNGTANMSKYIKESEKNKEKYDAEVYNAVMNSAREFMTTIAVLSSKSTTAYQNYYNMVKKEIIQMNKVVESLATVGSSDESALFESVYYQNSPVLQEYMFGKGIISGVEDEMQFNEFYNAVNDTLASFTLFEHKLETKIVNEEALVFAEMSISDYERFNKLQNLNEDFKNKVSTAWNNVIIALQKIFEKFMEKLTANFTTTKNYLDRYKTIIMKQPFNNYQLTMQNVFSGMERVMKASVPQLDYARLATLDGFNAVFRDIVKGIPFNNDNNIKPSMDEVQDVSTANTWFKSYFCLTDHEIKYTGKQFQQSISDIYEFLYDIRKTRNKINSDLKDLKATADKLSKQAGVDAPKADETQQNANEKPVEAPAEGKAPSTNNTDANKESVYSYLYQKYFTLNEYGVLVEVDINQPANSNTNANNGYGTKNLQNVRSNDNADNSGVKTGDKDTVTDKIKQYVDVCSSMLKSKMTACEFIRNEFMTVIRQHVQDHLPKSANKPAESQQPPQQPADQQK